MPIAPITKCSTGSGFAAAAAMVWRAVFIGDHGIAGGGVATAEQSNRNLTRDFGMDVQVI